MGFNPGSNTKEAECLEHFQRMWSDLYCFLYMNHSGIEKKNLVQEFCVPCCESKHLSNLESLPFHFYHLRPFLSSGCVFAAPFERLTHLFMVIDVGGKEFRFTWLREVGDLCDVYEERKSGEDGSGLLVESSNAWRKLNVQRILDKSTTNHVKKLSEEAERRSKSRSYVGEFLLSLLEKLDPWKKKEEANLMSFVTLFWCLDLEQH